MPDVLDYRRELASLASLACDPASVDAMLDRALDALAGLVPYDLAAVMELDEDTLSVRRARGALASPAVQAHRISLAAFPTLRRALETRRPIALEAHHHASDEGDPYDGLLDFGHGHSCMVVPLFAADRTVGLITLDRRQCERYPAAAVEMAGIYGQIVSLALVYAEQARRLESLSARLKEQNRLLVEEVGASDAGSKLAASRTPAMAALVRQARLVADTDTAVLIQGETGAGKEVLAQAIHEWSPRRAGPFVKLNCAAIPENLVEAELFGHTRGAFSGAAQARAGRFLTANGGTLLLDEIGDLGLAAQAKLLRVLQEGTFEAVGSDRTTRVDVRVIAASHVDLAKAVAERRFREDLYYRLAVFPLRLPPLRERVEDLPALGAGVLGDIRRRTGRGPWTLGPDAVARLAAHRWPGNVRELVNVLERATILAEPGVLGARWFEGLGGRLPAHPLVSEALPHTAEAADLLPLDEVERRHVRAVLERCGGRIYGKGGAAEVLGLKPSTLQSLMQRLGVERTAKGAG